MLEYDKKIRNYLEKIEKHINDLGNESNWERGKMAGLSVASAIIEEEFALVN